MMKMFNAHEVLKMAIRIEENGAAFYRNAAGIKHSHADREFFEALARVEDRHKISFEAMHLEISQLEKTQPVFDPDQELSLYLNAMADAHGGEGNPYVLAVLTGKEPMEEIISTAIGLEKESILFYMGLKDIVPPGYGQERIDKIIEEEKKHIVQLNEFLTIAKKTAHLKKK